MKKNIYNFIKNVIIIIGFKIQFIILELIFILLMIAAVPIGAHGTVVGVCVANLLLLAWFWYNLVRSVDVTSDGTLRFWIGNIEIDVPFDKIISIKRVATSMPCCLSCCLFSPLTQPYRGFLATPTDGVAIVTSVPSTPFWLWPRSAGKPDRSCCFGILSCPRLTVVFSPQDGSLNFIREVENEMRNFTSYTNNIINNNASNKKNSNTVGNRNSSLSSMPRASNQDYLDV